MPSRSLDPDTVREVVDSVARALEAVPRALEQQLSAVEVPLPAPATPGRLVELVRSLREAPAQVDLLRRLLAGVAEQGARAALFVLRDGRLVGWEGTRFDDEPELAGDLSGRALPEDSPAVRRVLDSAGTVPCTVGGDAPVPDFGQTLRGEAWLVPLRVLDRLAAVLYVDPAGTEAPDLHAIEVLVEVAGAAVERLAAARAREAAAAAPATSPAAPGPGGATGGDGSPEPPGEEAAGGTAAAPETAPGEAPPPATAGPETGKEESGETGAAPAAPAVARETEISDGDFDAVEVALELEGAPAGTGAGDSGAPAEETAGSEDHGPETGVAAGAAPAVGTGETAGGTDFEIMTPEELGAEETGDAAEEDARRFARLLMQEILLYHRGEVEQGRASRSILARLAEPIANARRLYEQRVPDSHPARMAWFEEEMIRVLAEGNPDLLGQPEGQEA